MDYTLAALKLLCIQLKAARPTHDSSQSSISYGPILFQRAWLQGVIISLPSTAEGDGRFLVDDGTGVVELVASRDFINRDWKLGAYVMVVGGCVIRDDDLPLIKVHKIVDLSAFPHREAMWYLEVMEAYKLFYKPLIEDP
ncbi:putative recQ-mediated genome instability protein [Helianthus annuus]|nr:putative recQ-mediated genome instability protein [Helianthus annuus]KAJ0876701.1 putative recQ-mediated genome instability protein [Helianthus annuus]